MFVDVTGSGPLKLRQGVPSHKQRDARSRRQYAYFHRSYRIDCVSLNRSTNRLGQTTGKNCGTRIVLPVDPITRFQWGLVWASLRLCKVPCRHAACETKNISGSIGKALFLHEAVGNPGPTEIWISGVRIQLIDIILCREGIPCWWRDVQPMHVWRFLSLLEIDSSPYRMGRLHMIQMTWTLWRQPSRCEH